MTANDHTDADHGSASLATVLVAPLMVVLMFVGFQAAMFNHTATEARVVAKETAVLVARDTVSTSVAASSAQSILVADSLLGDPQVSVSVVNDVVVVVISGRAPGILRGTSRRIEVRAAVPLEGWAPL